MVDNEEKKTSSIVWKLYYWLMTVSIILLIGLLIAMSIIDPKELSSLFNDRNIFSNLYDIMFILIYIASIVGLRGFIYNKKYFSIDLWKFIFFMILVEYIANQIYTYNDYDKIEHMIIAFTTLPILYALYEYTFKMNYMWSINDN